MEIRGATFLDVNDLVSRATKELSRHNLSVVVMDKGKYVGIIDDRTLRELHADPAKTKAGRLAKKAPLVPRDSELREICHAFFSDRFKALPVTEGNRIVGLVSRKDLLELLLEEKLFTGKKAKEIMTSPVVTIEETESLAAAKNKMHKEHVRRLVVTRAGRIAGMLSTFDLASIVDIRPEGQRSPEFTDKVNLDMKPVKNFMRGQVEWVGPDTSLAEVAKRLVEKDISTLVISSRGAEPEGIVTMRDLFETILVEEEGPSIYISGLDDEDKEYYPDIMDECKKLVEKLGKSVPINSLTLHVRRYKGHKYSMRARLATTKGDQISVKAFEWDPASTTKALMSELESIMAKKKSSSMRELHRRH